MRPVEGKRHPGDAGDIVTFRFGGRRWDGQTTSIEAQSPGPATIAIDGNRPLRHCTAGEEDCHEDFSRPLHGRAVRPGVGTVADGSKLSRHAVEDAVCALPFEP